MCVQSDNPSQYRLKVGQHDNLNVQEVVFSFHGDSLKLHTLKAMIVFHIESRLSLALDKTCSTAKCHLFKDMQKPTRTRRMHAHESDLSAAQTEAKMQKFLRFTSVTFTAIRSNGMTLPEHTCLQLCSIHPRGFQNSTLH